MNWTVWWLFVPVETVLCLTPGPAVLLVLATALRRGPRASVASTLGILSANSIYFALSATGLGAVLLASYRIFFLIKWAGAAYLIYLGVKALLSKSGAFDNPEAAAGSIRSSPRLFMDGLLLQLSNPKAFSSRRCCRNSSIPKATWSCRCWFSGSPVSSSRAWCSCPTAWRREGRRQWPGSRAMHAGPTAFQECYSSARAAGWPLCGGHDRKAHARANQHYR